MALIQEFERTTKERQAIHKPTRCTISDFLGVDNRRYLQIDTFGSANRDFPDKISQSIQLNEDSAAKLKELIESVFPSLR